MKKTILKNLKHFLFHKTDVYLIKVNDYSDLGYKSYDLKRRFKIFLIGFNKTIEKSDSLKQNKLQNWIYEYGNQIINIKQIF